MSSTITIFGFGLLPKRRARSLQPYVSQILTPGLQYDANVVVPQPRAPTTRRLFQLILEREGASCWDFEFVKTEAAVSCELEFVETEDVFSWCFESVDITSF